VYTAGERDRNKKGNDERTSQVYERRLADTTSTMHRSSKEKERETGLEAATGESDRGRNATRYATGGH
jgi:hypothetical protein